MGFLFSKEVIAVPTSNVALNLHVGPWPMGFGEKNKNLRDPDTAPSIC
ncbi:hypothetical protein CCACVL1_14220 [Corchorus capsularis]|uniref:Uncharacterized protein n=1 Tax=Corchorus capsularis TaxID=210143 RepID=A0A1R3I7Y9_COCAP|nr:hypothetical protein CCACVL1_14220 [Corchorus capsularis]